MQRFQSKSFKWIGMWQLKTAHNNFKGMSTKHSQIIRTQTCSAEYFKSVCPFLLLFVCLHPMMLIHVIIPRPMHTFVLFLFAPRCSMVLIDVYYRQQLELLPSRLKRQILLLDFKWHWIARIRLGGDASPFDILFHSGRGKLHQKHCTVIIAFLHQWCDYCIVIFRFSLFHSLFEPPSQAWRVDVRFGVAGWDGTQLTIYCIAHIFRSMNKNGVCCPQNANTNMLVPYHATSHVYMYIIWINDFQFINPNKLQIK